MDPNDKQPAPGTGVGAGSSSSFSERKQGHHRRRSSVNVTSTLSEQRNGNLLSIQPRRANEQLHQPTLSPIPGTPMTNSRSPSPIPGSTWSSPTLNSNHSGSGRSTPSYPAASPVPWEATKMRNLGASPYPSFSSQSPGFFKRHMRRLSSSLPRFATSHHAAMIEKEEAIKRRQPKLGGTLLLTRARRTWNRLGPKLRLRLIIGLVFWLAFHHFYGPLLFQYRRASWAGGGENYVMILPANKEGGVMDWKSGVSWAIERDSIRNKQRYVERWGYNLEIVDMKSKRKYAHEWRESWEMVDKIRDTFKKYPDAEWIWWLDLNTVIMEPSYSLQSHIFKNLGDKVYRDINVYNPLKIKHPFTDPYLDADALSPVGDGDPDSINLILSQDCAGFSLGSFFIRRSAWTERLLDVWWDPVAYEQMHRQWAHQEQSALETLYANQPWIRQHTAFLPQRMISSYPQPACGDGTGKNNTLFHYDERDRDFVVNMAGCETEGRSCWAEMYFHRQYSYWLNRTWWEKFKEDLVAELWFKLTGHHVKL